MITKTIKYIDVFTSEEKEVTLYFHLNKFEWLELETYTKGGLVENLKTALSTNNTKKTIDIQSPCAYTNFMTHMTGASDWSYGVPVGKLLVGKTTYLIKDKVANDCRPESGADMASCTIEDPITKNPIVFTVMCIR